MQTPPCLFSNHVRKLSSGRNATRSNAGTCNRFSASTIWRLFGMGAISMKTGTSGPQQKRETSSQNLDCSALLGNCPTQPRDSNIVKPGFSRLLEVDALRDEAHR